MLTNLPRDIVETVYDNLHIKDRAKLNLALPKMYTVKKTTKTDSLKDRKISLAYYFFSKRGSQRLRHTNSLYKFVSNNKSDPTCAEIINTYIEPNDPLNIMQNIIADLKNGIVNPCNFKQFLPTVENVSELRSFIVESKLVKKVTLEKLIACPESAAVLKNLFQSHCSIMFNIVNYKNEDLLALVLDNKDLLGITEEQVKYINMSATIFRDKPSLELMLQYFTIPYETQQTWLENAIKDCNVETAEWLLYKQNVSL
jgi:hypothetical protein